MKARLYIRRNSDMKVIQDPEIWDWWDDHEYPDFVWSEGNFACDCNRYLFRERAQGYEPSDEEDEIYGNCGIDRYSVKLTTLDGIILYNEFED